MLSDFVKKKSIFFTLKTAFLKVKKIAFFQGITHAFGEKMPIVWFI